MKSTATLYQDLIHDVLADAGHLMERVTEATRLSLKAREDQARTPGEHRALLEARQHLARCTFVMADRYPGALRKALERETAPQQAAARSLFTVHFDDLELMDETQVSESVERARARQVLASAAEAPLAELDALVSAARGLPTVAPEHNPLRPEVFLQALQDVVTQMQATGAVRHEWIGHMAQALGKELRQLYLALAERLKQGGVQPVGYAMRQADGRYVYLAPAHGASPGFAPETGPAHLESPAAPPAADPLLTLDRLRRLLLGEFGQEAPAAAQPREAFAERFEREFESPDALPAIEAPPSTDFAITVPAAFEALQEMGKVGHMMERLDRQRASDGGQAAAPRRHTGSLAQALSAEVVALMVDNIAHDTRLLWPVQQFVQALEPALLQLALADPRFFSDKEHPARRLLQEITDRSLAFDSVEASGFQDFMRSLMDIVGPLSSATIEGPQDFEQVLQQLHAAWAEREQARKRERLRAIEALQHVEQRHLLAAKISRDIWLLPQIGDVPHEVSRFLLGPWSQVMAEAQQTDKTGSPDPGRYRELVDALIWSAQPRLTRLNVGQLARLLPKLLSKLREGLATIGYPEAKTEAFIGLLMQLHQQAFQSAPAAQAPRPEEAAHTARPALPAQEEPWVAPSEAQESGYMDSSQAAESEGPPSTAGASAPPRLAVGTWVNLLVGQQWERTQLSWVGPHGTLFLFTSASGRKQSMTLRLLERLIQQGAMHVLTQQTVVDGALDAVARAAMRNSVDSQM